MDTTSLTKQLIYDLVDNWRDPIQTKYIGWSLLRQLQATKSEIHTILENKTLILNLFSVLLETILKYEFRITFAQIFNILMCTPHRNSMFMFQHITSTRSPLIGAIVRLSLDIGNATLLKLFTEVRANAGKNQKFRTRHSDIDKTRYAKMAHEKISLYREYLSREHLNIDLCNVVLNDLFCSICGQSTLKDTFCDNDGWSKLMNALNYISSKGSAKYVTAVEICCNITCTLLENDSQQGQRIPPDHVSLLMDRASAITLMHKDSSRIVEVAISVLCNGVKMLQACDEKVTDAQSLLNIINEVKSIHTENIVINQSSGILKMMISDFSNRTEFDRRTKRAVNCHSGRSKTRSTSSSKRSRARAARDNTVAPPRSNNATMSPSRNDSSTSHSNQPLRRNAPDG